MDAARLEEKPNSMYHWEADEEDFLMLAGEAVLVIEGEERALPVCDFGHCPVGATGPSRYREGWLPDGPPPSANAS